MASSGISSPGDSKVAHTTVRKSLDGRAHRPSRHIPANYWVSATVILAVTLLGVLGLCLTGILALAAFLGSNPIGQFVVRAFLYAVRRSSRVAHHGHRNIGVGLRRRPAGVVDHVKNAAGGILI